MKIAYSFHRNLALTCGVLLVGASGELAAQTVGTALTANSLSFAHHQNSLTSPQPQTVRVLSNPNSLSFTAIATTNTGGAWLLVNGATSANGITGTISQDLQIGINPLGLPSGAYAGTISVNVAGAAPNLISVSLTVSPSPQVVLNPTSLFLTGQQGTSTSTQVTVNSTGAAIPFTAAVTSTSPASPAWLSVTPSVGTTGTSVTIIANTTGLQNVGIAVGTISFVANAAGGGTVTLPVTFSIGGGTASLVVNPTSTNIAFQLGTSQPSSRPITVTTSSSSQVQYTAQVTSGAWLSLSSIPSTIPGSTVLSGQTPNPFHAVANPVGLGAGTYEGRIQVTSPSLPGSTQEVTVRLIVSTQPLLQTTPEAVTINHTLGTTVPSGQLVSVTSTGGQALPFFAAAATTTGGDWLIVSPTFGATNQNNIQVSLNATRVGQLASGAYAGTITITANGVGNSPLSVPVTLNVSGSTLISVNPQQLTFNVQAGQTPAAQSFAITSADASNQTFSIAVEPAGTNWLVVSPTFGSTGATGVLVNVNVNPNAITAPGTYDATLVVTPLSVVNAVPQRIPVKLTVIGASTVTANPTRVDFTQSGATAPQAQNVTLTSTVSGNTFLASASQPWITVSPSAGTLSSTGTQLAIGVNSTGLAPGNTYEGIVTVSVSGITTISIPVRFMFQNSAALAASTSQLNFTFQTGAATPATQNIGLTSNGVAIAFTATAATNIGGSWLSVSPTSGTTAASGGAATNVTVSVNPTGLTPGTYTGTVTLTGQNTSNPPVVVNVQLVVTNPAPPVITAVQNAATNSTTSISPGLIIAIKGTNMGPATGIPGQVQSGFLTTTIGEVRVLFDNVPAPILFASQVQVNAIAPYFLANRTSTRLVVEFRGIRSEPIDLRVVETAPGLFTLEGTQGAILNQDNTVNGPNNPAARGSVIVLYATGEGALIPAGADGRVITATELRRPAATVQVRIGGVMAEVLYAGSAVGLVSGAVQVNVRVPANLQIAATTVVPVELIVGSGSSATAQNVTATVRP